MYFLSISRKIAEIEQYAPENIIINFINHFSVINGPYQAFLLFIFSYSNIPMLISYLHEFPGSTVEC